MRVGVIGSGHIGATVAALAAAAGHDVAIANSRGPETLAGLAGELGLRAETVAGAAAHGELVVVATPLAAYADLPRADLTGKVVLDAGNYYPDRDGHIAALDDDTSTSTELLAAAAPGRAGRQGVQHPLLGAPARPRRSGRGRAAARRLHRRRRRPRARARGRVRPRPRLRPRRDGQPGRRRPPAADRRPALGRPGHRAGGRSAPGVTGTFRRWRGPSAAPSSTNAVSARRSAIA